MNAGPLSQNEHSRRGSPATQCERFDEYCCPLANIRGALKAAGVEFIAENGGGASVRLRKDRRLIEAGLRSPVAAKKKK